jgi:hypothetical protein
MERWLVINRETRVVLALLQPPDDALARELGAMGLL